MSNRRTLPSKELSEPAMNMFSYKRYFINNLDSFQGEAILSEVSKVLAKNARTSTLDSTVDDPDNSEKDKSLQGEDDLPLLPIDPYEIIGTVTDPNICAIENVARIVPKEDCISQMLTCGNVVFDISYDRDEVEVAMDYLKLLKDYLETAEAPTHTVGDDGDAELESPKRYLILISTVMSWACTKPLDPENPEMPFVETDFRKRKPHPNYKIHYDAENEVIGIARHHKSQIGAIVVNTGLCYGGKEDILYYWFQKAWECEPTLPIFGRGNNTVPLINVMDLAQIIYGLLTGFPRKLYILAVEQTVSKQREIVKSLGKAVGSGMFKCIPTEDVFLIPEMDQRAFDLLSLNLNMEPVFVVEEMDLQWVSETPFPENISVLIRQFKNARRLKPFKVVIYGPPIVGKTTLAKRICEAYNLIYISPETIVADMIKDLEWRVEQWEAGEFSALPALDGEEATPEDNEDIGEEESAQENARQTLALLRSGRPMSDDDILGYIRQKMLSKEAQNRGWILDGYPMNLTQCNALFQKGEGEEEEDEEEDIDEQFDEDQTMYEHVLKKLLPDMVVSLEATDEFVCAKAMRQPEGDPRLEEEAVLKRLLEFRVGDTRDVTPLNFYDEIDIHPFVVQVNEPDDYAMDQPYREVTLRMGSPCRYPKLMALIEATEKKTREELETLRMREEKIRKELELKMQREREERMEYWTDLYAALREEEEQALAISGEPMRNYLMNHIFPTLTPALLEVAKLRPKDPVDFLAEYLFKLNPTGKMLDPGYNLQAELLMGRIKILDDALKDINITTEPLVDPEADIHGPEPPSRAPC